jgi:hypothetical protein
MKIRKYVSVSVMLLALMLVGVLASAYLYAPTPVSALNPDKMNKIQLRLLSGFAAAELLPPNLGGIDPNVKLSLSYLPKGGDGCATKVSGNTKVNQNCLNIADPALAGRSQAENEPAIAVDPNQQNHLVAGYNDYRRGDGTCGVSYSLDGGHSWNDATLPTEFTYGTNFGGYAREYWQASGDPSVAWDTKGNAYFSCQQFNRGTVASNSPDFSSAVYVYRSTANFGASWNFPGRPAVEDLDFTGATLQDKPYMTVDNHVGSPYQDRVYVTWTNFASDFTAYIYEVYSDNYGETFSAPVLVSTNDGTLCSNTYGLPTPNGNCNENQFSDPFTGSDGALYVAYANYNNPLSSATDNHNQVLLVKSTDGGASFSAPVKVADYYDLPDCATYQAGQDAFRACVPEKGANTNSVFRAANYPAGVVNPSNPSQVVVTFASYISVDSQESNGCVPDGFSGTTGLNLYTGVKDANACNNKILLSVSTDGGATFTGTSTDPRALPTVNQATGQATTDQWWQWVDFSKSGKLAVSYYDRQYGDDETSGAMDYSLSGSTDNVHFATTRVTSSSMPLPTDFPDAQGNSVFFGDYTGLSAVNSAHPIWADTRDLDLFVCPGTATSSVPPALCAGTLVPNGILANDQDIFTSGLGIP